MSSTRTTSPASRPAARRSASRGVEAACEMARVTSSLVRQDYRVPQIRRGMVGHGRHPVAGVSCREGSQGDRCWRDLGERGQPALTLHLPSWRIPNSVGHSWDTSPIRCGHVPARALRLPLRRFLPPPGPPVRNHPRVGVRRCGRRALRAHFGRWRVTTPLANISAVATTGPYAFLKTAGPARLAITDRGLTFATNGDRGVLISFHSPSAAWTRWECSAIPS